MSMIWVSMQELFSVSISDLFSHRYPHHESTDPWGGKGASHTFQSPQHSANKHQVRDLTEANEDNSDSLCVPIN